MDVKRKALFFLIMACNTAFAVLGFNIYKSQLMQVPKRLWLFVPDAPLFALFFVIAAIGIFIGKRSGTFELITWLGMIKYSMWTVFTVLLAVVSANYLRIYDLLIIAVHIALFLEGLILTTYLNINLKNLFLTAVIFLTADLADWSTPVDMFAEDLGIYPKLPQPFHYEVARLESWVSTIGLLGVAVFYYIMQKRIRKKRNENSEKGSMK